MPTAAQHAMMTWIGALARGGVVRGDAEAGRAVAAFVVGEEALAELREWLSAEDLEVQVRERRAAVECCILMAHADREIHPEERHLLRLLVGSSGLEPDIQDELVTAVHEPPPPEGIEARLTHPVLRELIIALAWELALADGQVDELEEGLFALLAKKFEVSDERAAELQEAIAQEVR